MKNKEILLINLTLSQGQITVKILLYDDSITHHFQRPKVYYYTL